MIFRRRALSELFVHHMGCNGLGGIAAALILLPIALWPGQPVGAASKILGLFCSVMVVVIDVWWRSRPEEREHGPRAVNWLAGGTICYRPGWFCGTASTAIVLFAIFVCDVPHVPKMLHPSTTATSKKVASHIQVADLG